MGNKHKSRVILLVLALSFVLTNITGCGVFDKIEKWGESVHDSLEESKEQRERDKLTTEEKNSIRDENYEEAGWGSKAWASVGGFFTGRSAQEQWAKNNSKDLQEAYEDAANDKKLAKKEENSARAKKTAEELSHYIPIIIIAVLIVLLVVIFVFLSKRSAPKPVRVPTPKTAPEPAQVSAANVNQGTVVNVDYEHLLRENCKKLGLDYNTTLKQYGSARRAAEATNLALAKG